MNIHITQTEQGYQATIISGTVYPLTASTMFEACQEAQRVALQLDD